MNKNCLANSCFGCAPRKDHLLLDDLPPETKGLVIRSSTNGCMADSGYTRLRGGSRCRDEEDLNPVAYNMYLAKEDMGSPLSPGRRRHVSLRSPGCISAAERNSQGCLGE
jgi:hypothetical protein